MSARDKERAAAEQERADRRLALQVENGLRQALATEEGRALLWWIYARECGVEQGAYTTSAAEHTHYLEGRRSVGLAIAQRARSIDWAGWLMMRDEHERPRQRVTHGAANDAESEEE